MTIQVKPVYRKPEEGQGQPGRVLDKDDTQRLLIKARSSVLHMEAGYTTDNLLLSLTVECLAMREETIYVPPRALLPCRPPGTSSTSSMSASAGTTSAGRWLITGFGAANPRIAIGPHGLSLALYGAAQRPAPRCVTPGRN